MSLGGSGADFFKARSSRPNDVTSSKGPSPDMINCNQPHTLPAMVGSPTSSTNPRPSNVYLGNRPGGKNVKIRASALFLSVGGALTESPTRPAPSEPHRGTAFRKQNARG